MEYSEPKIGDVFLVPAKTVHAIGAGCLILEVQEPTDFTIQPERWCGDYHLSDNEMYIGLEKDTALSVFDYSYNYDRVMKECKKTPVTAYEADGCKKEILISTQDTPCFSVERYIINNGKTEALQGVCVYVVTDGIGKLVSEGYEKEIKKGDYFFMPYSCDGRFFVESAASLTLAKCVPPEV